MHGAKEVFQASDSSAVYKCGKADLGGGGGTMYKYEYVPNKNRIQAAK